MQGPHQEAQKSMSTAFFPAMRSWSVVVSPFDMASTSWRSIFIVAILDSRRPLSMVWAKSCAWAGASQKASCMCFFEGGLVLLFLGLQALGVLDEGADVVGSLDACGLGGIEVLGQDFELGEDLAEPGGVLGAQAPDELGLDDLLAWDTGFVGILCGGDELLLGGSWIEEPLHELPAVPSGFRGQPPALAVRG
jgi:hypothetical protein